MDRLYQFALLCALLWGGATQTFAQSSPPVYEPELVWAWALNAPVNQNMLVSSEVYGGEEKSRETQKKYQYLLNEWWNVTNRKEVLATAHQLLQAKPEDLMNQEALLPLLSGSEREVPQKLLALEIQNEIRKNQAVLNKHGLLAWDLARLQTLLGWAYMADLLNLREARELALQGAAKTQKQFASYPEWANSYLMGHLIWGRNMDRYEKRKAQLQSLLTEPDSPWVKQPWPAR